MNLAYLLVRSAQSHGDLTAVAEGDAPWITYRELARRAAVLAGALRDGLGLAPGDRVALIMANNRHTVELLFACWHAGLAAVPVNAKLHPREFAYVLAHSGARVCFVTPDLAETVESLRAEAPELERIICVADGDYARLLEAEAMALHQTEPDDLAWLFYTSGTTGRPKGAMLSQRNLMAMTASYVADVDSVDPGDAILHAAPMSHGSGLYILPQVAGAAAQVIPAGGGFDPAEVLDLIPSWPGLAFFAAPTMVKRLAGHPAAGRVETANLKTIVYGGGPMYLADLDRAHEAFGFKLAQIYGQGESPMTITALDKARHAETGHPRYRERLASVGTAQLAVQVRVADGEGRTLPPGEAGEVLVRGDSVMAGYWRDPEASAAALEGGWLWTGDLGVMDEDGFLTLRDRSKDLIISGGANIYPREVEEVLLRHPAVAEASVIGRPDAEWGEAVVACVVPASGRSIDTAALDKLCLAEIARFKRPKDYLVLEALPKNNYGKVLKTELRAIVSEREEGET